MTPGATSPSEDNFPLGKVAAHPVEALGAGGQVPLNPAASLAEENQMTQTVGWDGALDALPFGMLVVSGSHRVRAANRAAAAFLETTQDDLEDSPAESLFAGWSHADGRACTPTDDLVSAVLRGAAVQRNEVLGRVGPDGKQALFDVSAHRGSATGCADVVVVIREHAAEVDARGPAEREAAATAATLTAPRRSKFEETGNLFVAMLSHDMKAPLGTIVGYAEMLSDGSMGGLNDEQGYAIDVIARNAGRIAELVEDVVEFDKVGSPDFEPTMVETSSVAIVDEIVADITPPASSNGVRVESRVTDCKVRTDPVALKRVLTNLATNAVKYTRPGGCVRLEVDCDQRWVTFSVEDNGIGIPANELPALFTPFFRASTAVERHIPGTGLGLAIVRALVDALGGRIGVDSIEGQGTTFRVSLPKSIDWVVSDLEPRPV